MSLVQFFPKAVPQATRAAVEHILPADSICRLLGDKAQEIFDEAAMAEMYDHRGRGALNPVMMSIVLILQYFYNLPDREAADAARYRTDWMYALRQAIGWEGFNYASIHYFRKRLLEHGYEYEIFQQVLRYLSGLGYGKLRRIRTDATHIIGKVERLSRLELVCETLREALFVLLNADAQWLYAHLPAAFRNLYSEKRSEYRMSEADAQKALRDAGQDGYFLLERLKEHGEASWLELAAIETLAAVLDQQFERIEDGGAEADGADGADGAGSGHRVEPRAKPKADAICSPHDPDTRFGVKRRTKWLGYKGQMSETVPADAKDIPLIADIGIHSALQDDGAALPEIQDRLEARDMLPKRQYVDGGYISGKTIEDSGERGVDLRGFAREDTRKSPGFRLGDFMIDKENRLAICPAGKQSTSFNPSKQDDVDFHVRFGKQCGKCPLMPQCTSDKRGRSLEISRWHDVVMKRRREQASAAFKEEMHARARIESTIHELARRHGWRRSRYQGMEKVGLQAAFTATAVNLKRYARHLA